MDHFSQQQQQFMDQQQQQMNQQQQHMHQQFMEQQQRNADQRFQEFMHESEEQARQFMHQAQQQQRWRESTRSRMERSRSLRELSETIARMTPEEQAALQRLVEAGRSAPSGAAPASVPGTRQGSRGNRVASLIGAAIGLIGGGAPFIVVGPQQLIQNMWPFAIFFALWILLGLVNLRNFIRSKSRTGAGRPMGWKRRLKWALAGAALIFALIMVFRRQLPAGAQPWADASYEQLVTLGDNVLWEIRYLLGLPQ